MKWVIKHSNPKWAAVLELCLADIRRLATAGDCAVTLSDVIRSLDQNAKMWPMLADFAQQVPVVVGGEKVFCDKDDWKALLTAAFGCEIRMAVGLRGGIVMLGARTSKFTTKQMAEFITFLYAEGNERGVQWSEKSEEHFTRYAPKLRKGQP